MKKSGWWALVGVLMIWAVAEADTEGSKEKPVTTLKEVVVSVTQTETTLDKVGGNAVTVITAREIEEKKTHSLVDILKTVPGVTISSTGGMGTQTSVSLRGADSKNTLVLIDGVMLNDPSSANRDTNLGNISLDHVERIEVVRGAMSVMYGSNATAGVINIITRKGTKDPELTISAEGGSYGTWKIGGSASGATEKTHFSVSASGLTREGYSIADKDNDRIPQSGNTDEKDGYKNLTLSGKAGLDINENFKMSASLRYVNAEVDLDDYEGGYSGDNIASSWVPDPVTGAWVNTLVAQPDGPTRKRTESETLTGQVGVTNLLAGGRLESILSYKFSRSDRQAYDNNDDPWYDYKGDTDDLSWQGNLDFENSLLSFGIGYFLEGMESLSSSVNQVDTHTLSGWVQDQIFWGENLTLIAGVRVDDHEAFGRKATFRIAPSYDIPGTGTLLKAGLGTGFRSPSLYELFSDYGNPDLEPEESLGWDLGIEQRLLGDNVRLGLTYFDMDFKNRIGYDFAISRYNQLDGTTETSGVEVFADWMPVEDLTLGLFYTYTHTRDPEGRRLARRPLNQVGVNAAYRFLEKWRVGMDAKWVDQRDESVYAMDKDGLPVETLDDYMVVNVTGSCDVTDRFQVFARVENLFDEYYEEAFSYATPGLSGYLGVKWRW